MFALRGVTTAAEFVEATFSALESSSEETSMGTAMQGIGKELAWPSVIDAGDIMAEREGALWIIEVKSQTNTLNAASLASTIRSLKTRVERHASYRPATRQPIKAMIGVLRGPELDQTKIYAVPEHRTENRALHGFSYRYLVGRAFWSWLTGHPSIVPLLGDFREISAEVSLARQKAVERLQVDMYSALTAKQLTQDIYGVLRLAYEE